MRYVILFTLTLAGFVPGGCGSALPERPNIVFILADDMGYSDLGCYGAEYIRTPNIDALAAKGLRFTDFYNPGRCWPTRTCLMSGYYPHQVLSDPLTGVDYTRGSFRPVTTTWLPQLLKEQGYRSYHSGKWHLVRSVPENRQITVAEAGFDRSFRTEDGRHLRPGKLWENDRPVPLPGPGSVYDASVAIVDHGIRYLREHMERFPDEPFFTYLAFIAPHFPLQALPQDIEPYREVFSEGWNAIRKMRADNLEELGFPAHEVYGFEPERYAPWNLTQEELVNQVDARDVSRAIPWESLTCGQREFQALKMAIHAAMITRMDHEIGRFVSELERMGLLENTILFFCSDNGASTEIMNRADKHAPGAVPGSPDSYVCLGPGWSTASNTPFRLHKTWLHEGGIATPLVVHWPAGITNGGEFRRMPSHVVDIAPTLLELAGGSKPNTGDGAAPPGISLVPFLKRDRVKQRPPLFFHHENKNAIRQGNWKAVTIEEGARWELYDLASDRGETRDLAPENEERLNELVTLWERQKSTILRQIKEDSPVGEMP